MKDTCEKNSPCPAHHRTDENDTYVKNLKETMYNDFNRRKSDETEYTELKNVFNKDSSFKKLSTDGRYLKKKFIDSKNKVVDKKKMLLESDYYKKINYSDVLAMRPFPFTDLYNKVPKPKAATIKNGLPFWNNGSLDSKLYIIPYPEGLFVCTRGKIGEKLWRSCDEGDFVFYDIYGYEVSIPYDPVHDEHLKNLFSNPNNLQTLKKLAMVTDKLDARCTLKEYNLYRKYLYKIHAEALNKKLTSKVTRDLEETSVKIAIENTKKEVRKLLKSELVSKRQKVAMAKSEAEHLKKTIKCQGRMLRVQEVQKNNEIRKHDAIMKAEQRHIEFKNRIQQRVTAGAEIEHKRKIDALLQRQAADLQQKINDEQVRKKRQSDRENRIKERWEKKIQVQNLVIARDNTIRNEMAEELKNRAKKRLRTNMLQLKHRKEKLEELKVELIQEKERKRSETIRKNAHHEETIKEATRKIPKTIMKIVERFKKSQGITEFVEPESQPFDKRVYNEVKEVIIYLMETSIKSYIFKLVKKCIHQLISNCIEFYEKQISELNNISKVPNPTKRCSIQQEILRAHGEPLIEQTLDYEQRFTTQIVSFGSVITIDDDDDGSNKKITVKHLLNKEFSIEMLDELLSKSVEKAENGIKKQEKTIIKKHDIEILPLKSEIYPTLKYLCACVFDKMKIQISNFLHQYGNVTPLLEIRNIEIKETSIVDYITASFIYVIESKKDVDDDECVEEVVKFIALQILSIVM